MVGLYDVSLSEMTPDVLYATVCEKWARTILIVRDTTGVCVLCKIYDTELSSFSVIPAHVNRL